MVDSPLCVGARLVHSCYTGEKSVCCAYPCTGRIRKIFIFVTPTAVMKPKRPACVNAKCLAGGSRAIRWH